MVPIEEFKKSLGSLANRLSEEEIVKIRDLQDRLADAFFDAWLKKRNNKSYQTLCQNQHITA